METYQEIKRNHEKTISDIIAKNKIFFAFSDKQLDEGMKKLKITDKTLLTSLGMGTIALKSEVKTFLADMNKADKEYKKELKEAKQAKNEAILYELYNHEAFYTGRIDEVVRLFADIFTRKDIAQVYNNNLGASLTK